MSWISERWDAFRAAAGVRQYVIGASVSAVVAAFDRLQTWLMGAGMTGTLGVPSWVVAVIVALALIVYWLLEYLVRLRRRILGARAEIARLRAQGVEIRNRGIGSVVDVASWMKWEKEALDWNDAVIANIRRIDEADAEWFSILDVVPPPRIPPQGSGLENQAEYEKLFREHDLRVKRLGDMVYSLWDRHRL